MLQKHQKDLPTIGTTLTIEQVQCSEKKQDPLKFECEKENNFYQSQDGPKRQWTFQEDGTVFKLHNQFGNKWAIIAEHLKGKNDNSVKNHFYSRLRKGLRKLNKIIFVQFKKSFKQFKMIDLYKVIEASDQKFKQVKTDSQEFVDIALDLKNRLFIFAEQESDLTQQYQLEIKKLIEDFTVFTKDYKRKSKKNRRYSPMGADSIYKSQMKKLLHQKQSIEQLSNAQSLPEHQNSDHPTLNMTEIQKTHSKSSKKSAINNPQRKDSQESKNNLKIFEQNVRKLRIKTKKEYSYFSDDQDELKDDLQDLKQQKLDHFAQNILKTFKSYYSFQSFKSNALGDELFQ